MNSDRSKGMTTIIDLAAACGIGLSTIRHYQNIGLIPKPARAQYGGFRRYTQEDIDRLNLIRGAQEVGFSLKEIGDILRHHKRGDFPALYALMNIRKSAIQSEITSLNRSLESLDTLSANYENGETTALSCGENPPTEIGLNHQRTAETH